MDERDLSITRAEQSYIDDLNALGDWFLQYEYLLRISADLPRIPPERRTEEKRVKGCQSGVWLELGYADGAVRVTADSEALIIRGLLSIAVYLLNGRSPATSRRRTPAGRSRRTASTALPPSSTR